MPNGLGLDALSVPGGGDGGLLGGPLVGPAGAGLMPRDPTADASLAALDQLRPRSPNPAEAVQRITQALDLAQKLVGAVLAQVTTINPNAAKDLHQISRMLITAKTKVQEEVQPGPPPEMFMAGMGGGPLGMAPSGGSFVGPPGGY